MTVVNTTYSESELAEIFRGQDAVISAVGATGFDEQKKFIDAAVEAGVKRFLPSELSSNTLSGAVRELVPVFEPKKAVLDYLKEKEYTGLTWTGLAVGPMLDWVNLDTVVDMRMLLTQGRASPVASLALILTTRQQQSGMMVRQHFRPPTKETWVKRSFRSCIIQRRQRIAFCMSIPW